MRALFYDNLTEITIIKNKIRRSCCCHSLPPPKQYHKPGCAYAISMASEEAATVSAYKYVSPPNLFPMPFRTNKTIMFHEHYVLQT